MSEELWEEISRRGITRLCHFTPSRNFGHIAATGAGVLSTKSLKEDERSVFNATDLQRFDRHPDHICCSIEYPNAWYLSKAMSQEKLFKDWVVLFLKPQLMLREGTLFSPRNAAAGSGANLRPGIKGFLRLFVPQITGAYNRTYTRGPAHLACVPTDQQAEVLVPDTILATDLLGIGVRDEDQARKESLRLRLMGIAPTRFTFVKAPTLFEKQDLDANIRLGTRPPETVCEIGGSDSEQP